jgi:cytoskeletal protein RodZ
LREYAKYVGLDPDDVVNSYITAQQQMDSDEERERGDDGTKRDSFTAPPIVLLVIAVLLIAGVVTVLAIYFSKESPTPDEEEPAQQVVPVGTPPPRTASEPPPQVNNSRSLNVTLDFKENCWVEATVDGRRRISELRVHGDSLQLEGEERILLTLGNPGGVRIEVNGHEYAPGLTVGRVARDIDIDLDLLQRLEEFR